VTFLVEKPSGAERVEQAPTNVVGVPTARIVRMPDFAMSQPCVAWRQTCSTASSSGGDPATHAQPDGEDDEYLPPSALFDPRQDVGDRPSGRKPIKKRSPSGTSLPGSLVSGHTLTESLVETFRRTTKREASWS
jgi:hypothetical protein